MQAMIVSLVEQLDCCTLLLLAIILDESVRESDDVGWPIESAQDQKVHHQPLESNKRGMYSSQKQYQ